MISNEYLQLFSSYRTQFYYVLTEQIETVILLCIVEQCLSYYPFLTIVYATQIYGFRLPLGYIQTLLTLTNKNMNFLVKQMRPCLYIQINIIFSDYLRLLQIYFPNILSIPNSNERIKIFNISLYLEKKCFLMQMKSYKIAQPQCITK